jgi:hypothetical protein
VRLAQGIVADTPGQVVSKSAGRDRLGGGGGPPMVEAGVPFGASIVVQPIEDGTL